MHRRMSTGRRILLITTVTIGLVAWALSLATWTTFGRASTDRGFVDITVETIQSPPGLTATSTVIADDVETAASAAGSTISPAGKATLTTQVQAVLADPNLGDILRSAIGSARDSLEQQPDGPITIDAGALHDPIVAALSTSNPQLASLIPPAEDLTISVSADQVPSGASTAAGLLAAMKWLPLWLAIGAVVLVGVGLLVTDDRARTARRVGIAVVVLGIVPIVLRVIVPLLVGGAVTEGNASDLNEVTAIATLANWMIALIVTLSSGVVMVAVGIILRRPSRTASGPVVLGR